MVKIDGGSSSAPQAPEPGGWRSKLRGAFNAATSLFRSTPTTTGSDATLEPGRVSHPAKTTDNLPEGSRPRPLLRRAYSMSSLPVQTKEEACKQKEAHTWDCVDRRRTPVGGFAYKFIDKGRSRDAYEAIFPASEPFGFEQLISNIKHFDSFDEFKEHFDQQLRYRMQEPGFESTLAFARRIPELLEGDRLSATEKKMLREELAEFNRAFFPTPEQKGELFREHNAKVEFLGSLGYQLDDSESPYALWLPDRETLMANWERLREKDTALPPLDIAAGDSIEADQDFIEAFFFSDALLSSGTEFVHDHTSHVVPTLLVMREARDGFEYSQVRMQLIKLVGRRFGMLLRMKEQLQQKRDDGKELSPIERRFLKSFDPLMARLGAIADTLTAPSNDGDEKRALESLTEEDEFRSWAKLQLDYRWDQYFANRFKLGPKRLARLEKDWDWFIDQLGVLQEQQKYKQLRANGKSASNLADKGQVAKNLAAKVHQEIEQLGDVDKAEHKRRLVSRLNPFKSSRKQDLLRRFRNVSKGKDFDSGKRLDDAECVSVLIKLFDQYLARDFSGSDKRWLNSDAKRVLEAAKSALIEQVLDDE